MIRKTGHSHAYFWLLILVTGLFLAGGLAVSWHYGQQWWILLWRTCRNGVQYLANYPALFWQFIVPVVVLLSLARSGWSIFKQVRATRQLLRLFMPLRERPPARLLPLLKAHQLTEDDVVFLNLATVQAFCAGLRRPQIWFTAGLVELLTDEELAAVLSHEVHHYRQRDPLRLLISRALRAAFFFLPLVGTLARAAELQQEIEADRLAISHLGDELPLLSALQKLLWQGRLQSASHPLQPLNSPAVYNSFNVTEARLRRLIYPPAPVQWRSYLTGFLINLGVILILSSTIFLPSPHPVTSYQDQAGSCSMTPASGSERQTPVQVWGGLMRLP